MLEKTKRMQYLILCLNYWAYQYYACHTSVVSDPEYDAHMKELKSLEAETGLILYNSPTQKVGWPVVDGLPKIQHKRKLLSLENEMSVSGIISFVAGFPGDGYAHLSLKIDGLPMCLEYDNGVFVRAGTRGDGHEGQNVSHHMIGIADVPMRIPAKGEVAIVGEVYIHRRDFEEVKKLILAETGKEPKNIRNLASGTLGKRDSKASAIRRLNFMPFNVLAGLDEWCSNPNSKHNKLAVLPHFGYQELPRMIITKQHNEEQVQAMIDQMVQKASELDIPIDGLVVTCDDIAHSAAMGGTNHHFNDAIAFKFSDDLFTTVLKDIEWTVSRNGIMTPTAIFEPVIIDGTEVSRAQLFHPTRIKDLNLHIGCRIKVSKRRTVIPHVEENLDKEGPLYNFPLKCPCCGTSRKHKTVTVKKKGVDKEVVYFYCDNKACGDRQIRSLVHFAGEKAFDIAGVDRGLLDTMFTKEWISTPLDLFSLSQKKETIIATEGFGEKSYENIIAAIEASRQITFARFLCSMDIEHVGTTASLTISRHFGGDIDAFEMAVREDFDFMSLDGIGEKISNSIKSFFYEITDDSESEPHSENWAFWNALRQQVVLIEDTRLQPREPGAPLDGLTIVVTGTLANFKRADIEASIVENGGKMGKAVNKSTSMVLIGANPKSKYQKAKELGIPIIHEDEYLAMIA